MLALGVHPDAGDFANGKLAWDILNVAAQHETALPAEGVDLSGTTHLKPYALACLAALGIAGRQKVPLRLPTDPECRDHVSRLGLSQWFIAPMTAVDARATNLPIEHLQDRPGDFAFRAAEVWERQMDGFNAGSRRALASHLDEIVRNALALSESPIGCVVAGQAFPKKRAVEVAVLDFGQTIRGHLTRRQEYSHLRSDDEAIELATQDAVTGVVGVDKWGEPHSGAGLFDLRQFCEAGQGELSILSGSCCRVYRRDGTKGWPFRGRFCGTLVNVCFLTG